MPNLNELVEMEHDDPELVPEILPTDARLSIKGNSEALATLFARTALIAVASPDKEVLAGTSSVLLEAIQAQRGHLAYLRATASDGDKTVNVVEDRGIVVQREGTVLLPARRMHDIMKLVPSETTRIEVTGTEATIRSGQALWTVQIPSGDVLTPAVRDFQGQTFPVDPENFSRALSAVRRAASTSDARQSMMQIQLRNGAFTACDGGRVHRQTVDVPENVDVSIEVFAVDEILRAIRAEQNPEAGAVFGYGPHHILFETGNNRVIAQRLLVPFPQSVENLVLRPAFANEDVLRVNRRELIDVVKRVRVNANPDSAAVTLAVVPARRNDAGEVDWALSVRARDQARNSSQEQIECVWGGAKSAELVLNHHYVLDLLEVYADDVVFFKLGEDSKSVRSPLFIEDTQTGFTGVVQQMYSVR